MEKEYFLRLSGAYLIKNWPFSVFYLVSVELNGLKGRCGVPFKDHRFLKRYCAGMVRICMQTGSPALWTTAVSFDLFFPLRWQVTNYSMIKSTLEPQPGVPRIIEEGENKLSGGPCPLDGRGLQRPLH